MNSMWYLCGLHPRTRIAPLRTSAHANATDQRCDRVAIAAPVLPVHAVVLAGPPAAAGKIFLAYLDWLLLERRRHGVVPAVEEAEHRNHADDLDHLLIRPMLAHRREHLVGDRVRHAGGRAREVECGALGRAEQRARLILPDGGNLLLVVTAHTRDAGGVRHAVLAAGGTAPPVGDQALCTAIGPAGRP